MNASDRGNWVCMDCGARQDEPGTCGACGEEPEPLVGTRMTPPARYAELWAETESCLGTTRPFDEITWWQAAELIVDGHSVLGAFQPPDDIFLRSDMLECDDAVRHESVHAILMEERENEDTQWACGAVIYFSGWGGCPEL